MNFYLYNRKEILMLHRNKLIDAPTYVYLALKIDRKKSEGQFELVAKEFAERWELPVSSVYRAVKKLKKSGSLDENNVSFFDKLN